MQQKTHAQELLDAMQKRSLQHIARKLIHPFSNFSRQNSTQYIPLNSGDCITLVFRVGTKNRFTIKAPTLWNFTITSTTPATYIQTRLWKELSLFSANFFATHTAQLNAITFAKQYKEVKVQYGISRWGSCSSNGTIMLNPALLFVPPEVRDYVIVHELAHLLEQNHSKKYWANVARVWPEYKQHNRILKQYRLR